MNGHCNYGDDCRLKHDEEYKAKYALKVKKAIEISQQQKSMKETFKKAYLTRDDGSKKTETPLNNALDDEGKPRRNLNNLLDKWREEDQLAGAIPKKEEEKQPDDQQSQYGALHGTGSSYTKLYKHLGPHANNNKDIRRQLQEEVDLYTDN